MMIEKNVRMKVAVEASDRKDGLDKDHIYVDNQKIYRPFRSPDLYGVTEWWNKCEK